MARVLFSITALYYVFYSVQCGTLPAAQLAEQTLIASLLNGYNKSIRPDEQVYVAINAALKQILAIDEKQQIMTSSSFITQTWQDDRLSWTPNSSNNNIEVVMLPVKSLWIPDTMILNSADSSGYFTVSDYSFASVSSEGQVYLILPALSIKTRCNLYVRMFPFDKQMCSINLTSWSQGYNRIAYSDNSSDVLDIIDYNEHPIWKLTKTDVVVIEASDRSPFEDTYNDIISIQLYLERKPLFFIMNGIFACLVLNLVTLLAFHLPFGSQIGLCMTCFMTYSVYSLNFSNLFPQQSEYLMMITLFFLLSMSWTLISMGWFILCYHYTTKAELPKSLMKFSELLPRLYATYFTRTKKETNADKKKDFMAENGKINSSDGKQTTKMQSMKWICCHNTFIRDTQKRNQIQNIEKKQDVGIDDVKAEKIKSIEVNHVETVPNATVTDTNEKLKSKCDFCNRCQPCQTDYDKDKTKAKTKKDIEAKCNVLNNFIFFCVFLFMLVSNLGVWLSMAQ